MRSRSQIETARRNGAKSNGPITPHGKYKSSPTRLQHGLLAKALLLPTESRDQFIALCDSLVLEFNPTTTAENLIVQRMIAAQWRLFRVWNYERVGMLQESATAHAPEILTETGILYDPAARDAAAFLALHGKSRAGSVVQLSEMRYQRQFTEACKQLNYVRQNRALTKRTQEKPAIVEVSQNNHPENIPAETPGKPERYPPDTRQVE